MKLVSDAKTVGDHCLYFNYSLELQPESRLTEQRLQLVCLMQTQPRDTSLEGA